MREIRIFELEHGEPAETWRLAQAMQLHVSEGELWLTLGGDAGDYWLRTGESIRLPAGARVYLSTGREGARFMLALGGASASEVRGMQAAPAALPHAHRAGGFVGWLAQAVRECSARLQWGAHAAG
ncbi:DUF2917 domain-containing protein [Paraburkholderia tagetis]|uniref:DUF2917 domain-containing protein n=1 Tax=Paraburkholderia tagetis TaxID=2913261 RepID=A0A9X1UE89_9BURK|nr:DUF2917 domain-containing protein [Paraburkholderia tagetis]MCG5072970.1 DUF2917 domain-containing protein [Paraburkholderia tagetis]